MSNESKIYDTFYVDIKSVWDEANTWVWESMFNTREKHSIK